MSCTPSDCHLSTVGVCAKSWWRFGSYLLLFAWYSILASENENQLWMVLENLLWDVSSSHCPPHLLFICFVLIRLSYLACEGTETKVKKGPSCIIWTETINITEFVGTRTLDSYSRLIIRHLSRRVWRSIIYDWFGLCFVGDEAE